MSGIQGWNLRSRMMANITSDSNGYGNYGLETIDTEHSQRVSSSRVIELRRSPRVGTMFQARMILEYGKIEGLVTNLSITGLRFEAGRELADLLMKRPGQLSGHSSGLVEIYFDVPACNAADMPVVVQARVVHLIDNEEGQYMCGVEFKVFAEGEQVLADYLRTRGVET